MTTRRITPDLKAPRGATCYQCGAPAIVQCSVCDHCMCFLHAQFFNNVAVRQNAVHDYVECHACDDSGENEAEAAPDV